MARCGDCIIGRARTAVVVVVSLHGDSARISPPPRHAWPSSLLYVMYVCVRRSSVPTHNTPRAQKANGVERKDYYLYRNSVPFHIRARLYVRSHPTLSTILGGWVGWGWGPTADSSPLSTNPSVVVVTTRRTTKSAAAE